MSRLSISKWLDDQKCLSTTTHLWNNWQTQTLNWMSDGDTITFKSKKEMNGKQHSRQIVDYRTNGHVLWNVQFTSNISSNDGFYFQWHDFRLPDHCLHGWHVYLWKRPITIDHKYKIGPMTITGQRFIFETVEMWIPQDEDWISWKDHRRRKNIYGYFEIKRNPRLAYSFYRQTSQRIFRIQKLLSTIYSKLLWHCTTSKQTLKERQKICLDPRMSIFFWWNEETI